MSSPRETTLPSPDPLGDYLSSFKTRDTAGSGKGSARSADTLDDYLLERTARELLAARDRARELRRETDRR